MSPLAPVILISSFTELSVDLPARALDDDLAFDRLRGDEPGAALDDDVAAHGFDGDLALRPVDRDEVVVPSTFIGIHAGAVMS